jgi:predicted phage tail protein
MGFSLDPGVLFLSLITSGIGFVLFMYGKKQDRMPQLVAGIVLMVYPYFVPGLLMNVLAGAGIIGAMWLAIRQGW